MRESELFCVNALTRRELSPDLNELLGKLEIFSQLFFFVNRKHLDSFD